MQFLRIFSHLEEQSVMLLAFFGRAGTGNLRRGEWGRKLAFNPWLWRRRSGFDKHIFPQGLHALPHFYRTTLTPFGSDFAYLVSSVRRSFHILVTLHDKTVHQYYSYWLLLHHRRSVLVCGCGSQKGECGLHTETHVSTADTPGVVQISTASTVGWMNQSDHPKTTLIWIHALQQLDVHRRFALFSFVTSPLAKGKEVGLPYYEWGHTWKTGGFWRKLGKRTGCETKYSPGYKSCLNPLQNRKSKIICAHKSAKRSSFFIVFLTYFQS